MQIRVETNDVGLVQFTLEADDDSERQDLWRIVRHWMVTGQTKFEMDQGLTDIEEKTSQWISFVPVEDSTP